MRCLSARELSVWLFDCLSFVHLFVCALVVALLVVSLFARLWFTGLCVVCARVVVALRFVVCSCLFARLRVRARVARLCVRLFVVCSCVRVFAVCWCLFCRRLVCLFVRFCTRGLFVRCLFVCLFVGFFVRSIVYRFVRRLFVCSSSSFLFARAREFVR